MLAFIDESGQPHPNDPNAYSTLVALCMHEADHRELSRQLFGAKKALLGRDTPYELKALEASQRTDVSASKGDQERETWRVVRPELLKTRPYPH